MGGKIRGTAPKAQLVLQSLLSDDDPSKAGFAPPDNLWFLFQSPYESYNARVASNSWGAVWKDEKSQREYDRRANNIDSFVWHNPDHVIVFSAGNNGQKESRTSAHIGSSAAAKNSIVVGATESSRSIKGTDFDPTQPAGQPGRVAAFSSRGPTLEGRIKPDVVAPGVAILSAASRDKDFDEKTRDDYGPTKDILWMFLSGTSMATPLVAGCAAVLRESLIHSTVRQPSAALVKALLVNGAIDLGLERREQGFGRVFIEQKGFADEGSFEGTKLAEEETWTRDINLSGQGLLKITLAYSDRHAQTLQNNLSLKVNIHSASRSSVEKRGDDGFQVENNVEQVVYSLQPGDTKATITITAERIARPEDSQPFAVVWGVI